MMPIYESDANLRIANRSRRRIRNWRDWHKICKLASPGGFTLIEAVIVLGIVGLISAVTLVSFPAVSQSINLQRSSRNAALALRKAQNMSFAVRPVVDAAGVRRAPMYFGISVDRATPGAYILFADFFPGGSPNGRYDPGSGPNADVIVETLQLEPGIAFGDFTCLVGGDNQCGDVLNIAFSAPDAQMRIGNASQTVGESAELVLTGRGGTLSRKIIVRTTGQIQVK